MNATQLGLLSWSPPQAKEDAPEGVKRAVGASGVDPAILRVARDLVGQRVSEVAFWRKVDALVPCMPDTARRRRDELENKFGLLATERAGLGFFIVKWVKA